MTDTHTNIERIVMRRVHLIRILQLVISTAIFATLAFLAALWGIGREVWVARIFENAPTDPAELFAFWFSAFTHTRFIVQALIVLTVVSLGFLVREVIHLARNLLTHSGA